MVIILYSAIFLARPVQYTLYKYTRGRQFRLPPSLLKGDSNEPLSIREGHCPLREGNHLSPEARDQVPRCPRRCCDSRCRRNLRHWCLHQDVRHNLRRITQSQLVSSRLRHIARVPLGGL